MIAHTQGCARGNYGQCTAGICLLTLEAPCTELALSELTIPAFQIFIFILADWNQSLNGQIKCWVLLVVSTICSVTFRNAHTFFLLRTLPAQESSRLH